MIYFARGSKKYLVKLYIMFNIIYHKKIQYNLKLESKVWSRDARFWARKNLIAEGLEWR